MDTFEALEVYKNKTSILIFQNLASGTLTLKPLKTKPVWKRAETEVTSKQNIYSGNK